MTIKSQGGIFGRNPTFNDVTIDGDLAVGGSNVVVDSDIGSTVQAYDADTTKNDVSNTFTENQVFNANVKASSISVNTTSTAAKVTVNGDVQAQGGFTALTGSLGVAIGAAGSAITSNDTCVIAGEAYSNYKDLLITPRNNGADVGNTRFISGDVVATVGNFVIGTSGQGIDFSATSGTGTSELFDDYEEGTWTPTLTNMGSSTVGSAVYTKIGRTVHIIVAITSDGSITANSSRFTLPYTAARLSSGVATRGTSEGGFVEIQASTLCYFATTISTSGGVYVTATYEAA